MESRLDQLSSLLEECKKFTFSNFSLRPNQDDNGMAGSDSPNWTKWIVRVDNVLRDAVQSNSAPFRLLLEGLAINTAGNPKDYYDKKMSFLLAAIEEAITVLNDDAFGERRELQSRSSSAAISNRVFIVHGHDDDLKNQLEIFLTRAGLQPVVLHREPDKGQTIIEKFEAHSDVGFVFVLLTADEIAYTTDQATVPEPNRISEKRARPNVLFEFGYFVGRLGRKKVCCLIKGDVQAPSDLRGLLYRKVEGTIEDVGYYVQQELVEAGYDIRISGKVQGRN